MKYSAIVFNKHNNSEYNFIITVDPEEASYKGNKAENKVNTTTNDHDETSELCYHIALTEYEHCIKRMERLDNKIYIMLTVCAFIFIAFSSIITSLHKIKYPEDFINRVVVIVFLLGVLGCLYMFVRLIVKLIRTLATIPVNRFDSAEILNRSMVYSDKKKVVEYVIAKYEKDAEYNNEFISKKYKQADYCVDLLANTVVFLIVLMLFGNFAIQTKNSELVFVDVILTKINSIAINIYICANNWLSLR